MRFLCAVLLLCAVLQCVVGAGPVATTQFGKVEGDYSLFHNKKIWRGVPYAAPPLGPLRFADPQQPQSWSGVRSAKDFAADCLQNHDNGGLANVVSEDCLYLNVWAPNDDSKLYPIMVWFYGGSWSWGGTRFSLYDAERMLEENNNVVIVTVNYRLGVMGFLTKEDAGLHGSMGILDQREALRFVQNNIKAFGGDPSRVTIWGESAGAGSVSNHLVMPESWPYFHAAIAESGPWSAWIAKPVELAEASYDTIVKETKCTAATRAAELSCLRAYNGTALMEVRTKGALEHATNVTAFAFVEWTPVFGPNNPHLKEHPIALAKAGKHKSVPLMVGSNLNEGTLLLPGALPHDATVSQANAYSEKYFGPVYGPKIVQMYNPAHYKSPWWAMVQVVTDGFMACPARRMARIMSDGGKQRVFLYQFTHEWDEPKIFDPWLGVAHAFELPFVWNVHDGVLPLPDHIPVPVFMTPRERDLSRAMQSYWNQFVYNGTRSVLGGAPAWPSYNASTDLNIQLTIGNNVVKGLKKEICDFWDTIDSTTNPSK